MSSDNAKAQAKSLIEEYRAKYKTETSFERNGMAICAAILAVLAIGISIFWLARANSANMLNKDYEEAVDRLSLETETTTHAFDLCGNFIGVESEDIFEICGVDHNECVKDIDTKWHLLFEFNGVILFFLGISFGVMSLGACFVYARLIGSVCVTLWNFFNVICILVTPALRFNT